MATEQIVDTTQYLSFVLQEEVFAFDIGKVREVLDFTSVTKIPQTPDFMRGVINLRGGVVPVIDLRMKFGMSETEKTVNTCVIIVEVEIEDNRIILGALADSVKEVFNLHGDEIEPAPRIGTQLDTSFLKGMGKKDNEFILILDIDRIFSLDELDMVQQVGELEKSEEQTEATPA
jgi:purine-binding chemotaxis protein CheW